MNTLGWWNTAHAAPVALRKISSRMLVKVRNQYGSHTIGHMTAMLRTTLTLAKTAEGSRSAFMAMADKWQFPLPELPTVIYSQVRLGALNCKYYEAEECVGDRDERAD